MDVRLTNNLNSGTAQVEDRFEGTTLVDLTVNGRTVIPAGALRRGVVTAVEPATRTNRTAKMTVSFDQVTVNGRAYPIRGTVTQAIQGEGIKGETGRIATGAGAGANPWRNPGRREGGGAGRGHRRRRYHRSDRRQGNRLATRDRAARQARFARFDSACPIAAAIRFTCEPGSW
jgi:hypothetical protein